MEMRFSAEKIRQNSGDFLLLAVVILLLGIGLAVLFSASYFYGELRFQDPLYFLKRQFVKAAVGAVLAFFLARIPMETIRRCIPTLLLISFILTGLTFVPGIGKEIMGARRWIFIGGMSFQPSELAKVAVILYLAYIFSKKEERIDDFFNAVFPPLLVVFAFITLIYFQNDFSTAFFLFLLALAMFFIARIRVIYFILLGAVGIPLAIVVILTKEHRVRRILAFLNPDMDPIGAGFQVNAAQDALINGGIWGVGLGEGIKKLGGLPEAHSDFVFAVLGEEMGFIGVVFIVALFTAFSYRGYSIALKSEDRFGYYLAFGITTAILFQALLNIAVVSGIVPATGIPLPFFSSGGSSIVITLLMCGLLLNLSRNTGDSGNE